MKMFLSSANGRHDRHPSAKHHLCDFIGPRSWAQPKTKIWAADNDCFNGFDRDAYVQMLKKCHEAPTPPVFVTLPDVVADAKATMDLWRHWHRILGYMGLNRAFVLQDGVQPYVSDVPWDYIEALFIGGTTEFKLGPIARYFIQTARLAGKWVHMGRVNSNRRLHYARLNGCDSCDGSGMSRFFNSISVPMMDELDQPLLPNLVN